MNLNKPSAPIGAPFVIPALGAMLAPSTLVLGDLPLTDVSFPRYVSTKYNGHRCLYMDGRYYGRGGKEMRICNTIKQGLLPLAKWADANRVVLDGEMNSSLYNTVGATTSILAGTAPIPEDFKYKVFYIIPWEGFNQPHRFTMEQLLSTGITGLPYSDYLEIVRQNKVATATEFLNLVEQNKYSNIEGFMLLDGDSHYHHGRSPGLLKYKYYGDAEDAQIVGITERRQRRADTPTQSLTPLGKAGKVYKQECFEATDVGGCLEVRLENGETVSCPFPLNYSLAKRKMALAYFGTGHPEDLRSKWITFKRLSVEKGKPQAIKYVEVRDCK